MSTFTVTGLVATTPRHLVTQDGLPITSFRLAESVMKFNRTLGAWENGDTNWFTVTAFHSLAVNAIESINKGERITVTGELKVRDWDNGERAGTSVEIEAEYLSHDLRYGTATFNRTTLVAEPRNADPVQEPEGHSCTCNRCERNSR